MSLNSNESERPDRFIEVKTYRGTEHFNWSDNERDKASVMGDSYFLYLVDDNLISMYGYDPIIIANPAKVIFKSGEWLIEPDSFRIEKIVGWANCPVTGFYPNAGEKEALLLKEGDSPHYGSDSLVFFNKSTYSETVLLRAFNIMQEAGFFVDDTGQKKSTKMEVFKVFGDVLHVDLLSAFLQLSTTNSEYNDSDERIDVAGILDKFSEEIIKGK